MPWDKLVSSAPMIIAILAFLISIYTIHRDRINRQFEMLHKIILSISDLNRCIAETITYKDDEELKKKQKKTFLTELKNQYEFLAFLINRKQIKSKHVFELEKKFIKKFVQNAKIEDENYPELHKLLCTWKKK